MARRGGGSEGRCGVGGAADDVTATADVHVFVDR